MSAIMLNVFMDDIRSGPRFDWHKPDRDWEHWIITRSVNNTKKLLELGLVHHMSLDNDMGSYQETGYDLVKWMYNSDNWPSGKIYVHSANAIAARNIKDYIRQANPDKLSHELLY